MTTTDTNERGNAEATMGWKIRSAVEGFVTTLDGQLRERPISLTADLGTHTEAEPLEGIAAALLAVGHARGLLYSYVRTARSDGLTWRQVGKALALEKQAKHEERPLAELAFEYIAGAGDAWRPSTFGWRCGSCLQMVTDRGPYNGHPRDDEYGHSASCQRLRRARRS